MSTPTKNHQGFTLVELLIAMAVSSIVLAGIYSSYNSQQKAYVTQQQVVDMQQNLRTAMHIMGREIRIVGFDPRGDSNAGIISATGNTFQFTFVADNDLSDNDNDGETDETGELETIEYDLYDAYDDGDNDIGRKVGSVKRSVAENIENMEFYYTLSDNTQSTTPANIDQIRSVQITILARTAEPIRGFTDTKTYPTPSGAFWGPFNDHYKRDILRATFKCRNLGI